VNVAAELQHPLLAILLFAVSLLYASVGHGGASGYLAVMALLGVDPLLMKPVALVLNIAVSSVALLKFYRVGAFSWRLFWPLALTAIPLAYLGGRLTLPVVFYRPLVGVVLWFAAWRLFQNARQRAENALREPSLPALMVFGPVLGLLSGLTGVGGGIFLSPLLLFLRWAPIKVVSGVSAAFILVNSIAGVLGIMSGALMAASTEASSAAASPAFVSMFPAGFSSVLLLWAVAVLIGGYWGAEYGSRRLGNPLIQKLLSLVLVIAGAKMMWL